MKRKVSFGMSNRGNTCFFNSAMQCLAHTLPLHQFLLCDGSHSEFCAEEDHENCLICVYRRYLEKAQETGETDTSLIEPFMAQIMPLYQLGRQEDAQEFLVGFIDHLIQACFKHPNPSQSFVIKNQAKTPIYKIFGFQTRSQVLCQSCGFSSNTYADNCSLTLQIP